MHSAVLRYPRILLRFPDIRDLTDQVRTRFEDRVPVMLPSGRADFVAASSANFAESANLSDHLRYISTDRRGQDLRGLNHAIRVNNEPSADVDIGILIKDSVVATDLSAWIGEHRERHTVGNKLLELMIFPALVHEM